MTVFDYDFGIYENKDTSWKHNNAIRANIFQNTNNNISSQQFLFIVLHLLSQYFTFIIDTQQDTKVRKEQNKDYPNHYG